MCYDAQNTLQYKEDKDYQADSVVEIRMDTDKLRAKTSRWNSADTKSEDNDDEEHGDTGEEDMHFEPHGTNVAVSPHK